MGLSPTAMRSPYEQNWGGPVGSWRLSGTTGDSCDPKTTDLGDGAHSSLNLCSQWLSWRYDTFMSLSCQSWAINHPGSSLPWEFSNGIGEKLF